MTPTITAFAKSPDRGRGLARDMAVRWALEEVGQPYDVRLVPWEDFRKPAHLAVHPFGKIPTYEEGNLTLFESGAIVLHVADQHPGTLFPGDANARARAIAWMFAALTTVQEPIVDREAFRLLKKDKPWFADRVPMLDKAVRERLDQLSTRLCDAEWLDGEFSAGDLLMINVLRRPAGRELLDDRLAAYVTRGEARPAFKRAFDDQREVFERAAAATAE